MSNNKNWFLADGQAYAAFRPSYPHALCEYLSGLVANRRLAIDVGCGTGQFTKGLLPHFEQVVGIDPSADQINQARLDPSTSDTLGDHSPIPFAAGEDFSEDLARHRPTFLQASAEALPFTLSSADLVTAAQAAHWFDLSKFYDEVRRVTRPGGVLALVSYGVLTLDPNLDDCFQQFYWKEINPYWPPERRLVDQGYRDILFPFDELEAPHIPMVCDWTLPAFLGYLSTWSAVNNAELQGKDHLFAEFAEKISYRWGASHRTRRISWPLSLRIARL